MLDLTFGEQVKIVLSRKGMTIKELAEIIEERTGKKMSRQNLTQRLGRDNFQEQDMRMIADILGCPFQLSILADINEVERAANIADVTPTEKELSKLARAKERKEERKEKREEKPAAKVEENIEVKAEAKPGQRTFTQRYIVAGRAKDEHKEFTREVTIGELADMPKKKAPAKEVEKPVEKPVEEPVAETPAYEESAYVEPVYEEPAYEEPAYEEPVEEYVEEPVYEEYAEEAGYEEYVEEPVYEEYAEEPVYEEQAETGYEENNEEVQMDELLNTIDEIEKERQEAAEAEAAPEVQEAPKQEEKKARGWRAMFQRRQKKEEPATVQQTEPVVSAEPVAESEVEEPAATTEPAYEEPVYEGQAEEYVEEAVEEQAAEYESDYIDYESSEAPEEEFEEVVNDSEEDTTVGDINPYTGHEYESNSVRMHPKRIGYVQVYDRSDHQWTDMTEWAFLGYQERKKALLGKDYEPPIYLD